MLLTRPNLAIVISVMILSGCGGGSNGTTIDGNETTNIAQAPTDQQVGPFTTVPTEQNSSENPELAAATDSEEAAQETETPITDESTTDESTTDESTTDESTTDESTTDESTTDESTTDESTTDESTTDESTTDESTTDESTTDESTTEPVTTPPNC